MEPIPIKTLCMGIISAAGSGVIGFSIIADTINWRVTFADVDGDFFKKRKIPEEVVGYLIGDGLDKKELSEGQGLLNLFVHCAVIDGFCDVIVLCCIGEVERERHIHFIFPSYGVLFLEYPVVCIENHVYQPDA